MARLPIPGSDDGTWGDILNAYLEVSHASDGTLNANVVGTAQLQNGSVTNAKLDSSTQSAVAAASTAVQTVNSKSGPSVTLVASDVGAPTTLAGDSDVAITSPADTQVLTYETSSGKWKNKAAAGASGPTVVFDTPEAHGAKRNGLLLTDVTITHSSNTLTSTSATFTSANIGMHVIVQNPAGGASLTTTVSSVTDSHHVVLAATNANLTTTNAIIGTDDTAAIAAAVSNAVATAQAAGETYAEVWFSEGIYMASGATTKGGSTLGNSQIPLPVISATASPKFTLAFKGIDDSSAPAHWLQTVPNVTGSVICSTLQSQTNDGTWGYPSVIGGPSPIGLSTTDGGFMNMHVIIDGISLVLPFNPTQVGFDFRCLACVTVKSASIFPFETPANLSALGSNTFNGGCVGLYMPNLNNNDLCEVGSIVIYGVNYGIGFADHFNAKRLAIIFCNSALLVNNNGTGSQSHGAHIDYASIEGCNIGLDTSVFDGGIATFPLSINHWDTETLISFDVDDPSNVLSGEMWYGNDGTTGPSVSGGAHFRILQFNRLRGAQAGGNLPAVPSSTTALLNPLWRDCAVTVSGGTVTAIAVDGTATGITSGTVIVPTGKTIKLTYSGTPSWTWIVL